MTMALSDIMQAAQDSTLSHFGNRVTFSKKVFIPLTQLCRDVCHYCTFAKTPKNLHTPYLSMEQVLEIAQSGKQAGCTEALFTLGDKPELRYNTARDALSNMGFSSTLDYLYHAAKAVYNETGLLPHLNPGLMNREEMSKLREVSASMGIMLESTSLRLTEKGGPHFGSPDKHPTARLETLRTAGELKIPFTTGLLIGIGETREERVETLNAIAALHSQYGHIQEVIIQNFCPKPNTLMADQSEPPLDEHLWTIATARQILGPEMSIQAPPNLQPGVLGKLIRAGINDWGGVSPITPDHVNPERPWPHLHTLAKETKAAGRQLVARLPIAATYLNNGAKWVDPTILTGVLRHSDSEGMARDCHWHPGTHSPIPVATLDSNRKPIPRQHSQAHMVAKARKGMELTEREICQLFSARDNDWDYLLQQANDLRLEQNGDVVTYVVNRNINYTNICQHRCEFCAFAKGQGEQSKLLRGTPYNLDLDHIAQRALEAWRAGATEVCLQGGIHPSYTGETYLNIVAAVKKAVPDIHVHAFSPLEVHHGATTLGLSLGDYLAELKRAGLATLPGTAAEILDDEVRQIICPDKLNTERWLQVIRSAHDQGLGTTATIMFGHVESPVHWARHLLHIRRLQQETGGFTEFVPLPYVHMEAPLWRKGLSRSGPTFREAVLMHAVARLVLNPLVKNIQTSWVKMGADGAAFCLQAGANDLGGTLMNESITRAAGGVNGQQFNCDNMRQLASRINRPCQQRTTLYGTCESHQQLLSN